MPTNLNFIRIGILLLSFSSGTQAQDEIPELKTSDGQVFKKATITKIDDSQARITHSDGISKVYWSTIPNDVRLKFGTDAKSVEQRKTEAKMSDLAATKAASQAAADKRKEMELYKAAVEKKLNSGKTIKEQTDFETLSQVIITTMNHGQKYKELDPFLGRAELALLIHLGKPDKEHKYKGQREHRWFNAVKNTTTGKVEGIVLKLGADTAAAARTGRLVLTAVMESDSGDKVELPEPGVD
jgi:hypothetical protein